MKRQSQTPVPRSYQYTVTFFDKTHTIYPYRKHTAYSLFCTLHSPIFRYFGYCTNQYSCFLVSSETISLFPDACNCTQNTLWFYIRGILYQFAGIFQTTLQRHHVFKRKCLQPYFITTETTPDLSLKQERSGSMIKQLFKGRSTLFLALFFFVMPLFQLSNQALFFRLVEVELIEVLDSTSNF